MPQFSLVLEIVEDENWLGGSMYLANLLAALSVLDVSVRPAVRLRFLSSSRSHLARRLSSYPVVTALHGASPESLFAPALRRIKRALTRRIPLLGKMSRTAADELVFPVFDNKEPWRNNLYWIPDFQPHHLPDLFHAKELSARTDSFKEIARARGVVVLSSQAALADFLRFYPDAIATPRVWSFCSSIEAGPVADCHAVIRRLGLPEKFLYVANQFWRHKDHATVFEALALLRKQGMEIPVVCTGLQHDRRDPAYFGVLMDRIASSGIGAQLKFLGVVPREDQIQLFRAAAAVLQPSRFEGWSTVIEDAKALGRPVIASDIAVHAEQLAGLPGAHLFENGNAADLADKLAALWPGLNAGPSVESEKTAALRRDRAREKSARRFVEIAQEAFEGAVRN